MLEYWMANNDSGSNGSEFEIKEVLEDPGSAVLFAGYPPWLLYFAAGCCILFMLIGIPGNLITVAALFRTKKLRNATAVFIMNLSLSDLMFCCFNLPLATSTFWQSSWMHGPLLCRLFPLLRYGLVAVSLFTVLAITINRYVMIGHPRLYPRLYKRKYLVLMVLATWISGFGALVATWFEQWGRFGLDPVIGSCSILPDVNGRSPKEFLFILAFLAPCVAIIVCYARIFYIVRKTALRSRRKEKVTSDLVKASIEIQYTKNFEDSAIGSSCGATLTTTENGGSPTRYHAKANFTSSTSSNVQIIPDANHDDDVSVDNDDDNDDRAVGTTSRNLLLLSSVESSKSSDESKADDEARASQEMKSPNEIDNSEVKSDSERDDDETTSSSSSARNDEAGTNGNIENSSRFGDLTESVGNAENFVNPFADDCGEVSRTNFELSVEFIPFIDTCGAEQQQQRVPNIEVVDSELDSCSSENTRSIPNLQFFKAASASPRTETERRITIKRELNPSDYCLRVPRRFPRFTERTTTRESATREISKCMQILDTKSLETDEKNGFPTGKDCLHSINMSEEVAPAAASPCRLLSPRSVKSPSQYNSQLSDDYVSSRSESPNDRRESSRMTTNVFRRESRFRSVKNNCSFETGKMTTKDKKLLKMILVIFSSFLICYLPITITKTFKDLIDWRGLNIAGYILIYLTTCINPIIYVVMSSEYRCAYKNVLLCRSDSASSSSCKQTRSVKQQLRVTREEKEKQGKKKRDSIE